MYACVCSLNKRLTEFEHEMKREAVLMVMFLLISPFLQSGDGAFGQLRLGVR